MEKFPYGQFTAIISYAVKMCGHAYGKDAYCGNTGHALKKATESPVCILSNSEFSSRATASPGGKEHLSKTSQPSV